MKLPTLAEINSALSRKSLFEFVKYTQNGYTANWFNRTLCNALESFLCDVQDGRHPILLVEAPPQHGKSQIVSKAFPAWALGHYPDIRIVNASYASSLAERNSRDTQRMMEDDKYRMIFPATRTNSVRPEDAKSKAIQTSSLFEIVGSLGSYRAVGVGGGLTGNPFDIGIIDDPFKDHEEAYSANQRDKVWNWWSTVFLTRRSPKHGVIVMNTRWHDDDLTGRLMEEGLDNVTHLKFKAIATEDEEFRKAGEALLPERYDLPFLLDFKEKYPAFFAAMYQQTPIPEGGALFKSEMFDVREVPSMFDYEFITADTAYKDKQENDFTVFTAFGVLSGDLYIKDVWKQRINADLIEKPAAAFIKKHSGNRNFRGAYIEPKGHGIYLNMQLPRLGVIMPSDTQLKDFFSDRTKNKVERANNVIPYMGNRKIVFNKAINNTDELLKEALTFPKAKHDDFVDTLIDGVKFAFARQLSILDVL